MMKGHKKKKQHSGEGTHHAGGVRLRRPALIVTVFVLLIGVILFRVFRSTRSPQSGKHLEQNATLTPAIRHYQPTEKWLIRAYAIDELFHQVFTPCWEGAYGAIGDAHLFAVTGDSALLRFYSVDHEMTKMCTGTWVDDRAWICLAEMYWWQFTGKTNTLWVQDAMRRYAEARNEGRLSDHEGFWSWYNWPPNSGVQEPVFSNSNMNQMASVACRLYEATGEKRFLDDALLVWNGDSRFPGVEKTLYKGNGQWEGKPGLAAFGAQLPWKGAAYCSIGASLYRVTKDPRYKRIVVATAKRLMDPDSGWVDPVDFYQLNMDGNGAFVHYILDAYQIAPDELPDIPPKVEKMLEHVWTNAHGRARVTLHRVADNGIRNGWNPFGGEQGAGVDEVGTVHAQGEAIRAFGLFAYVVNKLPASQSAAAARPTTLH